MVEGEKVFIEAINFLKTLRPLKPLQWDDNLAKSAQEHINDIGPKGLLLYQSSDGTEPEERISKYGTFVESLGENIDFGPNDAMGVVISLTLDDGESTRPHRENLFKDNYKKVGIACGPHKTEFQMCVMDFAYDFIPLNNQNFSMYNEPNQKFNLGDMSEDINNRTQIYPNNNNSYLFNDKNHIRGYKKENQYHIPNNDSPYVKLSLDNEDFKNLEQDIYKSPQHLNKMNYNYTTNNKLNVIDNEIGPKNFNEFEEYAKQVRQINQNKKVIKKEVKITTKITYLFEDNTTKEISETIVRINNI